MLFNSYLFVLLFLPLCIMGWYLLNHFRRYAIAQAFLLLMSLWFYGYFNPKYLLVIVSSVLFNYGISLLLRRKKSRPLFCAGLLVDLALLLAFKYTDFFIAGVNRVFRTDFNFLHIMLPLGISFFTFQQISFLVDCYRGEVPEYGLLNYALYVCYFPQLVAGPIVTHSELVPQFMDEKKKRLDWENLAKGIYLFTVGLSKKVLLADVFGRAVDWGYSYDGSLSSAEAAIVVLGYTFQIYFDFSGYCDMASGIAKMMNIDLPANFSSPYKALTITEFWDRWHMTLTRFFTKYVYIPLGGNRRGAARTYLNIFIVFFLSGFWHGAGLGFIFWGVCHGLFSIVARRFKGFFARLHPALGWLITFAFLNITWIFFRAPSLSQTTELVRAVLSFKFRAFPPAFVECFKIPELDLLTGNFFANGLSFSAVLFRRAKGAAIFALAFLIVLMCRNAQERTAEFAPSMGRCVSLVLLMLLCIGSFSGISAFLYFNF